MKYVSQVENKVTNIFVLNEGILVEFCTLQMPAYSDIKEQFLFKGEGQMREEKSAPKSRAL